MNKLLRQKSLNHILLMGALLACLATILFFLIHFVIPQNAFLFKIHLPVTILLTLTILVLCIVEVTKFYFTKSLMFDELTGLPSFKKFKKDARYVLENSSADEYSIISIDISKFRYLQTSLGNEISENVLKILAKNFVKTAPQETLICRKYTDNFVILLKSTFRPVIEDQVLNMLSIVSSMGNLLPLHYTLEFSIGVYVVQDTDESITSMIDKANTARLFGKKSLNPRRITFYTKQMDIDTEHEKEILFDMNRAFEDGEFIAYYQPKFNFSNLKIVGAEALVRWNHKEKGLLSPAYFVPLFEKNGFIQKIDKLIFESVCKFLDEWNKSGPNESCPEPLTISCNLSRFQLYNPEVAKEYSKIASNYKISPSKIEIELTESLMMDNKERLLKAMNDIKNAGFQISVDDFGSGFSSLTLLKDIPANVLKLDKEFLGKSAENQNLNKDGIIVNSVIDMAKKLNMTTVAEGIEEAAQANALRDMGCDIAQGYLYAKPMPKDEFKQLLTNAYIKS